MSIFEETIYLGLLIAMGYIALLILWAKII